MSQLCHFVPIQGCKPDTEGKVYTRCLQCGYVHGPHFPVESSETGAAAHHRTCDRPDIHRVPVPLPNIFARAGTYITEWIRHRAAGAPMVSFETILKRFRICSACEMYNDVAGACSQCGCYVNLMSVGQGPNALEWADKECPLPQPRWTKEIPNT